jgi:hypothetical protein
MDKDNRCGRGWTETMGVIGNLQRLLSPQCFNLSFPQRIWAWVGKKKWNFDKFH